MPGIKYICVNLLLLTSNFIWAQDDGEEEGMGPMRTVARFYGSDTTVIKRTTKDEEYYIKMDVDVFQASEVGYVLPVSRNAKLEEEEQMRVLPAFQDMVIAEKILERVFTDEDVDPEVAMEKEINVMNSKFAKVNASMYADVVGEGLQRQDMGVKEILYDSSKDVLVMVVEFAGEPKFIDLPEFFSNETGLDQPATSPNATMDLSKLAVIMDEYAALIEVHVQSRRRKPMSPMAKLKECTSERLVELKCMGPHCREVLAAAGAGYGWDAGDSSYSGVVTGRQCCQLYEECIFSEKAGYGDCGIKDPDNLGQPPDDALGAKAILKMQVGGPGQPGNAFQAQCQPDCHDRAREFGACRYKRERCRYNCRCSWWC